MEPFHWVPALPAQETFHSRTLLQLALLLLHSFLQVQPPPFHLFTEIVSKSRFLPLRKCPTSFLLPPPPVGVPKPFTRKKAQWMELFGIPFMKVSTWNHQILETLHLKNPSLISSQNQEVTPISLVHLVTLVQGVKIRPNQTEGVVEVKEAEEMALTHPREGVAEEHQHILQHLAICPPKIP